MMLMPLTFILNSKNKYHFYTLYRSYNGGICILAMRMHYKVKNYFRNNSELKIMALVWIMAVLYTSVMTLGK